MNNQIVKLAGVVTLAGLAAACSGYQVPSVPMPDEPGLYAVTAEDELLRLDGDRKWEVKSWAQRSAVSPYTEFVIYDPALARDTRPADEMVSLWRVAWVRSEIDRDGAAGPIEGSEWAVAPLESFRVPVAVNSVGGHAAYAHVVPARPLEPGLYSLRLDRVGSARVGRVGVEWNTIDKRRYAAENCVDRYRYEDQPYRTCAGDNDVMQLAEARDLSITLVDPLRQNNNLIVQGIVLNSGSRTHRLPGLAAVLLDRHGTQLSQVPISVSKDRLEPGERLRFKSEVTDPHPATARIDVVFVPLTNAGL